MSFGGSVPYSGERLGEAAKISGVGDTLAGAGTSELALGQTLTQPEITGNLPAGAQAQVDINYQNALNQIKARYGRLGQTGSTMEADALANVDLNKSALQFSIAQAMAQQGLSALGLGTGAIGAAGSAYGSAASIYQQLSGQQLQEDHYLTETLAKFAQAMGSAAGRTGGSGGNLLSSLFGGSTPTPAPGGGTPGAPLDISAAAGGQAAATTTGSLDQLAVDAAVGAVEAV